MTRNQRRAVDLAEAIVSEKVTSSTVNDMDWALLLLAADVCDELSPPVTVAYRVLDHFKNHRGLFTLEETNSGRWELAAG